MKSAKVLSILVVTVLALSGALILLTNSAEADDSINVCVTLPWQKEMVMWIGGGHVTVTQFVGPGADPHGGEHGTVSDLVAASKSIAYFYIGAQMEWEITNIPTLQQSFPNMQMVNSSAGLTLLTTDDDHDDEENDDHGHGPIDGHVWTSPANLLVIADNVKNGFIELDPNNSSVYEAGYTSYINRVNEIKTLADNLLQDDEGKKFLVWHSAWLYFCNDYNLTEISFESQVSGDVTPQVIANISQIAEIEGLNTIFIRPQDPVWADTWKLELNNDGLTVIPANPLAINYLDELESFITNLHDSWSTEEI